jgi:hypothetical protein
MRRRPNPQSDPFSAHEALDRAHLASYFFDQNVAEHAFVQSHPRLKKKAERLAEQLGGFYQDVGQIWARLLEREEAKRKG